MPNSPGYPPGYPRHASHVPYPMSEGDKVVIYLDHLSNSQTRTPFYNQHNREVVTMDTFTTTNNTTCRVLSSNGETFRLFASELRPMGHPDLEDPIDTGEEITIDWPHRMDQPPWYNEEGRNSTLRGLAGTVHAATTSSLWRGRGQTPTGAHTYIIELYEPERWNEYSGLKPTIQGLWVTRTQEFDKYWLGRT